MKVMCVHQHWFNASNCKKFPLPVIGSEYTVLEVVKKDFKGKPHETYRLKELPGFTYCTQGFAILPGLTAEDMQEQVREAIIM